MKLSPHIKKASVETICLLYILLFVYAAVSKFLDFENFNVQLGQSPLLSPLATYIAYGIPVIELFIAVLLLTGSYKRLGLLLSYSLMVFFTLYIFIILHYSYYVPCSCGGILEKMGWEEHLWFNIAFVILGGLGYLLLPNQKLVYET